MPGDSLSSAPGRRRRRLEATWSKLQTGFESLLFQAVDADHLAAFAAFDDLLKPPEEAGALGFRSESFAQAAKQR